MTSKERRKQHRRDEHLARKEANRHTPSPAAAPLPPTAPAIPSEALDFDDSDITRELAALAQLGGDRTALRAALNARSHPASTPETTPQDLPATAAPDHTERNRQNAQFSTGPKTPEALLVEKMAEHFWLSQRALRLQDMCFRSDVPLCDQPKDLALYLRYGTTHDRAFHKCIAELAKLRAEQRKAEAGFLSQQRQQAAETRKEELHGAKLHTLRNKQGKRKAPAVLGAPEEMLLQPFQSASNADEHYAEIAMQAA